MTLCTRLSKDSSQPELHHPLPQSAVRNYSHSISSASNGFFASSNDPTQMSARIKSSPHERPNQFRHREIKQHFSKGKTAH